MQQSWVIGAAESCDIRVASPYVSARHCRLSRDGNAWSLEDLGSTNGTFVNGVRLVGVAPVSPDDSITLGTTQPLPWPRVADVGPPAGSPAAGPRVVPLPASGGPFVIGRTASCDVVLDLPMVSARHAVVERAADGWRIRDLGSTNGTFIDGRRIAGPVVVPPGATISLGSCRLTLDPRGARTQPVRTAAAAIAATDLTVAIGGRPLIRDVSLVVQAGELVAVMGPSGAGKSTLLTALTGGQSPDRGRVVVAGVDLATDFEQLRGQIGHVPQDDIMHADLTVGQAVWYAARLRLPRDYRPAEIRARVATVLDQLGIGDVAHARIGTPERRGISGGQRKRVNVAMELITDPPILILDEPTSGLSSTDALALVQLLRRLADGGKTIVLTMHQPGVEVLETLDAVVVIARDASTGEVGELVWYGPAWPDAARFFEPGNPHPDAAAVLRGLAGRPVADWRAAYAASAAHRDWTAARRAPGAAATSPRPRRPPSFLDGAAQWRVLVRRMLAIRAADGWSTALVLLQAPVIALLVAAVFGPKTRVAVDHASWTDVSRALATTSFLTALAAIWFGCSNAAREIVGERAIYRRERAVGLSRTAYLAAKAVVLAGLAAVQCGTLLAIVHGGCGLQAEPLRLFGTLWLAANAATALGLCASAAVRSAEAANGILPLVLLPMVILGGILLPLPELPGPAALVADALPSRWAFEGLLVAEADARPDIELPDPDRPADARATRVVDLAEAWFPAAGWRSGRDTPGWMLAAIWCLGLATLWMLMARREARDR